METDKILDSVRRSPCFIGLTLQEFEWARANMTLSKFRPGEVITEEGSCCPGFGIVLEGVIKTTRSGHGGREQILSLVRPLETFNEIPAFDGGPCPSSTVALKFSRVAFLPSAVFWELLARNSMVTAQILHLCMNRLRATTMLAGDLTLLDVTARIVKALDTYARSSLPGEIRLSQEQLAGIVGTKRETVSRALRQLETRGAIRRRGHSIELSSRAEPLKAAKHSA